MDNGSGCSPISGLWLDRRSRLEGRSVLGWLGGCDVRSRRRDAAVRINDDEVTFQISHTTAITCFEGGEFDAFAAASVLFTR